MPASQRNEWQVYMYTQGTPYVFNKFQFLSLFPDRNRVSNYWKEKCCMTSRIHKNTKKKIEEIIYFFSQIDYLSEDQGLMFIIHHLVQFETQMGVCGALIWLKRSPCSRPN